MNRLTRKTTDEDYEEYPIIIFSNGKISKEEFFKICPYVYNDKQQYKERLLKIGKYEDLEEELGCSLNVLFKALKNGVYTLTCFGDMVRTYNYLSVQITIHNNEWKLVTEGIQRLYLDLKDYNKTWWLEKPKEEKE